MIKQAVCHATGLSWENIVSATRLEDVVLARQLFAMLMAEEGFVSRQIAIELTQNRSNISKSLAASQNLIVNNRKFKDSYLLATCFLEDLETEVQNG